MNHSIEGKPKNKNRTSASLIEYGFAVGSATVDSALTKSKLNRQQRLMEEQNTVARYKSSLNKVFNDEALSPTKKPQQYTTLDSGNPKNNKPRAYESKDAHDILNHQRAPQMIYDNNLRRSSAAP